MSDQVSVRSSSIGFTGLLTIVFIVLKLTHIINWSWLWVLSPSLITIGLAIFLFMLAGILYFLAGVEL